MYLCIYIYNIFFRNRNTLVFINLFLTYIVRMHLYVCNIALDIDLIHV